MKPCRALKRANRLRFGFKKLRKGVKYQIRCVRVDESPDQGALNHGPVAQPGRAPASKNQSDGETFNQVVASPKSNEV